MHNIVGISNKRWTIILRTQGERPELLTEALYSISYQTYQNKRLLLVLHAEDNKIIAAVNKQLENFTELFATEVILQPKNFNRSQILNPALEKAAGDYVSFLDEDDIYYPQMGELLISKLEKEQANFCNGNSIEKQVETGSGFIRTLGKKQTYGEIFNPVKIFSGNFLTNHSYIFDTNAFPSLRFDQLLPLFEDWDFLMQMAVSGKLQASYLNESVCEYRVFNHTSQSFHTDNMNIQTECIKHIKTKYAKQTLTIPISTTFYTFPDIYGLSSIPKELAEVARLKAQIDKLNSTRHQVVNLAKKFTGKLYEPLKRIIKKF